MKKTILYLFALVIVACTLNDSDPVLKKSLETALADSLQVLNMAEQTDFEWDEMIVLGPYSDQEVVGRENKVEFTRSLNSPIASFDYYNLIVFLKDKKEVAYVEVGRVADFEAQQVLIAKKDAVFQREGTSMKRVGG